MIIYGYTALDGFIDKLQQHKLPPILYQDMV